MSFSTMRDPLAIRLQNVSKIYKLHGSQSDQLIDVLGLQRFGIKTKTPSKEFAALSDISLDVPRGHRIGIVGRNGAGKTTLLKLICGNFAPTSGNVEVNGTVQALMNIGLGFHPEYTGRENVEASLQYNGLARDEYEKALAGIVEFCELGDFLDQPFKTYSLGMQARLMFASATAIKPDILIVDEVLGAGDAYFVAKSKKRVEQMVNSGCTMLLVSHSMQQILELCEEAIWIHEGKIRMRGNSLTVVKAYEEFIHDIPSTGALKVEIAPEINIEREVKLISENKLISQSSFDTSVFFSQEPESNSNSNRPSFPRIDTTKGFQFVSDSGISRWKCEEGLKITGFTILNQSGETNKVYALEPTKLVLTVTAELDNDFSYRCGVVFLDAEGSTVLKVVSPVWNVKLKKNESQNLELIFNPLQLGPGSYVISLSLHFSGALELFNTTLKYDHIGRSFNISILMPEAQLPLSAKFFHSAEWFSNRI